MSKLIILLLKVLCTVLFIPVIGLCAILLSLILWDSEYIEFVPQFQNRIWFKKNVS